MANKKKGVSGKTHTKAQLDNYANQNNPNNKAYKANKKNQKRQRETGNVFWNAATELPWYCYSNPYDFD